MFYTGHNRPRTDDLMLSDKSFIKIRNRIGPRTSDPINIYYTGSELEPIPGVLRIILGLDLRLDHLKLLVECTLDGGYTSRSLFHASYQSYNFKSQSHEETQTDFIKVRCLQNQFLPSNHPSLEFFAGHCGRGP